MSPKKKPAFWQYCTFSKCRQEKCFTISDKTAALDDALSAVEGITDITTLSYAYRDEIHTCMHTLRVSCDEAETITADKYWPFPTYDKLLFGV